MTTATTPMIPEGPAPLEIPGPVARVPSLDEVYRLTEVPDRRVVYRGVDWAFYERLVDSIPEGGHIHVDYDGRDVEIMTKGSDHEDWGRMLDWFIGIVAEEFEIPLKGLAETTWKRPALARGIESDQCYYFLPEKIAQYARARKPPATAIADCPNPDLAVEVDVSRPETDRAGIYAAMRVTEVWRLDGSQIVIERLTPQGTYESVNSSGFLPVRTEDIRRWIIEEDLSDEAAWKRRLRAWIRRKREEGT